MNRLISAPILASFTMKSSLEKFLFGLITLFPVSTTPLIAADSQPNVLFLAVDDMNDWVGCLETTPHAITPTLTVLPSVESSLPMRTLPVCPVHLASPRFFLVSTLPHRHVLPRIVFLSLPSSDAHA
jgi:hypothetical protein